MHFRHSDFGNFKATYVTERREHTHFFPFRVGQSRLVVKMSRTLRKAVDVVKQRKDTELNLPDEGIANLEDVPELCEFLNS